MVYRTVIAEIKDCKPGDAKPCLDLYFPPEFALEKKWLTREKIELVLDPDGPWRGTVGHSKWNQWYCHKNYFRPGEKCHLPTWLAKLGIDHKGQIEFEVKGRTRLKFVKVLDPGYSHPKRSLAPKRQRPVPGSAKLPKRHVRRATIDSNSSNNVISNDKGKRAPAIKIKLRDPLVNYPWGQLHEQYDKKVKSDFDKAFGQIDGWGLDAQKIVPFDVERPFYHWMVKQLSSNVGGSGRFDIDVYAAVSFWKLYSTSPTVPKKLITDRKLRLQTQKDLDALHRMLPTAITKNVDVVIELVTNTIGTHGIYGMKSDTSLPMRTTFLHFLYPDVVPIYDQMVLRAVGFDKKTAKKSTGDVATMRSYLTHAWQLSERYESVFPAMAKETAVRLIDMALWVSR